MFTIILLFLLEGVHPFLFLVVLVGGSMLDLAILLYLCDKRDSKAKTYKGEERPKPSFSSSLKLAILSVLGIAAQDVHRSTRRQLRIQQHLRDLNAATRFDHDYEVLVKRTQDIRRRGHRK